MALWIRETKLKDGSITKVWYGSVSSPTGRRCPSGKPIYRRETFAIELVDKISERKARKAYDSIKHEILNKEAPPPQRPTLIEFAPHFISYCKDVIGKRSWSRDQRSLQHLLRFFGTAMLSEIEPSACIQYQQARKKEVLSNGTINLELACLRHLFNVARLQGFFAGDNPVSKIRTLELPTVKDRGY